MTIFIIRHGETAGNADGVIQFPDTPLNERGIEQARRVGARLQQQEIARIIASDYRRTEMTAQQIQQALSVSLSFDELLRERHFGDLRGRTHAEVGDLYHPERTPPNGETWPQFHRRIDQAWERIQEQAAATDGNLAVVTHGLVCYSLALRHLELPAGVEATRNFGNTSVTQVEHRDNWFASSVNCCAHLDGVSADRSSAASGV